VARRQKHISGDTVSNVTDGRYDITKHKLQWRPSITEADVRPVASWRGGANVCLLNFSQWEYLFSPNNACQKIVFYLGRTH